MMSGAHRPRWATVAEAVWHQTTGESVVNTHSACISQKTRYSPGDRLASSNRESPWRAARRVRKPPRRSAHSATATKTATERGVAAPPQAKARMLTVRKVPVPKKS